MLTGKTVVIGVSGGIAAFKIPGLVSLLTKAGAAVEVIMTKNAAEFITPLTFETLTGRRCLTDTFDRSFRFEVEHVALAKRADLFMIAPATANVIAKTARGLADDMLTTTFLAADCPKLVAPSMNTNMYKNPATQDNLALLRRYGVRIIEPAVGRLACGDSGAGRLPEPEELYERVLLEIACKKDLAGKKILVTAGPTREALDPVRYLSNRSTGKMGFCLARAAVRRGASVTLVSGPCALKAPYGADLVPVESAADMFEAVTSLSGGMDAVIKAAAVADYTPAAVSAEKIKKQGGGLALQLERTKDILGWLGEHKKPGQFLCGFSMETENVLENSRAKLAKKNADMIVANSLREAGAGFGTDTNVVTLIKPDSVLALPLMSKDEAAHRILDAVFEAGPAGQSGRTNPCLR